jgi:16S rRNA processing protein RimM
MRLVPVGKIVACHGVRGFVRMACFNRPPSAPVAAARAFHLERAGEQPQPYPVELIRPRPHDVLVKFAGMENRTVAERVVGMVASLPETALPALGPGEFYYYEIVGFRVRTAQGVDIGTVVETFDTGSHDVWIVRNADREFLIPVIADVVRRIDRQTATVTIEPLDGLLDI